MIGIGSFSSFEKCCYQMENNFLLLDSKLDVFMASAIYFSVVRYSSTERTNSFQCTHEDSNLA